VTIPEYVLTTSGFYLMTIRVDGLLDFDGVHDDEAGADEALKIIEACGLKHEGDRHFTISIRKAIARGKINQRAAGDIKQLVQAARSKGRRK